MSATGYATKVDMGQKCRACDVPLRDHRSTSAQCPDKMGSTFQQPRACKCGRGLVWMPVGSAGGLLPLCPTCNRMEFQMYDRRKKERDTGPSYVISEAEFAEISAEVPWS